MTHTDTIQAFVAFVALIGGLSTLVGVARKYEPGMIVGAVLLVVATLALTAPGGHS